MTTDSDNNQLFKLIEDKFAETNKNIGSIQSTLQTEIADIHDKLSNQNTRIDKIENELHTFMNNDQLDEIWLQIELIKQDLRNNLRLTGLPPIAFEVPSETIIQIESVLQIGLLPSDFIVYTDRNKSSLILSFGNYVHKRLFATS